MQSIIILGSKGSGKKTLKEKVATHLSDFAVDIYSGNFSSSYDAAILVVSLTDGPMPETIEHLLAAHNVADRYYEATHDRGYEASSKRPKNRSQQVSNLAFFTPFRKCRF